MRRALEIVVIAPRYHDDGQVDHVYLGRHIFTAALTKPPLPGEWRDLPNLGDCLLFLSGGQRYRHALGNKFTRVGLRDRTVLGPREHEGAIVVCHWLWGGRGWSEEDCAGQAEDIRVTGQHASGHEGSDLATHAVGGKQPGSTIGFGLDCLERSIGQSAG